MFWLGLTAWAYHDFVTCRPPVFGSCGVIIFLVAIFAGLAGLCALATGLRNGSFGQLATLFIAAIGSAWMLWNMAINR